MKAFREAIKAILDLDSWSTECGSRKEKRKDIKREAAYVILGAKRDSTNRG